MLSYVGCRTLSLQLNKKKGKKVSESSEFSLVIGASRMRLL